jgi:hypothetical protein
MRSSDSLRNERHPGKEGEFAAHLLIEATSFVQCRTIKIR